jgi:hypothetical protein
MSERCGAVSLGRKNCLLFFDCGVFNRKIAWRNVKEKEEQNDEFVIRKCVLSDLIG